MNPIVDRVLDAEGARREHVVVALGGSRAFGFPSPDSDFDLECIHVASTASLVGLAPPTLTFDRVEVIEGVGIDYTSNELANVIVGILQGNGNFLERVLGPTVLRGSTFFDELRPLVQNAISKRMSRHYRGFAVSQLGFLEKDPTVKKLLYVLRTALTGTHLLRTGALEANLPLLLDEYSLRDAESLVAAKRAGSRTAAEPALLEAWRPRLASVLDGLDAALEKSELPDEPRGVDDLEAWLIRVRRLRFS